MRRRGQLRDPYDEAIAAAARHPSTAAGLLDEDESWDEVLARVDDILALCQREHLDAVRDAEAGGDVPTRTYPSTGYSRVS